ncbi:hypothetical protein [Paraburkholderia elongata]|uniref:Uncharacterized protein n=1 Tax=Paraburkholderia elongata TaxID=2675747 RepID=A0A972NYM8_9BURK|nr:hypothetical protein [Paraburkholderia elongata]NPT62241.1 hypothetical protein [Paraburkholderia elongata]
MRPRNFGRHQPSIHKLAALHGKQIPAQYELSASSPNPTIEIAVQRSSFVRNTAPITPSAGRVEICTGNRNEATFDIAESLHAFSALYALGFDYLGNQRSSTKKIAAISERSVSASVAHFSPSRTLAKAPDQWGDESHEYVR